MGSTRFNGAARWTAAVIAAIVAIAGYGEMRSRVGSNTDEIVTLRSQMLEMKADVSWIRGYLETPK